MFGLGTLEIVAILVIILILFGVGKLPQIGGGLGQALKNFKQATSDDQLESTAKSESVDVEGHSKNKA